MIATSVTKPNEFCISHTPRGREYPGKNYYRVKMGSSLEDQLRRRLNCSKPRQLEARLVFYDTNNFFDLVVRKSPFMGKDDKAKQMAGKAYQWSGEGTGDFLTFVMNDDKVIDYQETEKLECASFAYEPPFENFGLMRVTPAIADFIPDRTNDRWGELWDDEYGGGQMVCMTFNLPNELKKPITRNRPTADERKRRDATNVTTIVTKAPTQLKLDLTPMTLLDEIAADFKALKLKIVRAARDESTIVTLEGSGEDVSMMIEQIQRRVVR